MSEPIVLYDYFRSSASFRVRIALGLKGLSWETRTVDLRIGEQCSPTYAEVSPAPLVPTLAVGDLRLTQSLAIIEWLDATHPSPRLVPQDPLEAARVREVALAIACDIHPINNLRVLKYLESELGADDDARTNWIRHWIVSGFDAVQRMIVPFADNGPYCVGGTVSLADVCLVPQAFNARRYGVEIETWPRLAAIDSALRDMRAIKDAWPTEPA